MPLPISCPSPIAQLQQVPLSLGKVLSILGKWGLTSLTTASTEGNTESHLVCPGHQILAYLLLWHLCQGVSPCKREVRAPLPASSGDGQLPALQPHCHTHKQRRTRGLLLLQRTSSASLTASAHALHASGSATAWGTTWAAPVPTAAPFTKLPPPALCGTPHLRLSNISLTPPSPLVR